MKDRSMRTRKASRPFPGRLRGAMSALLLAAALCAGCEWGHKSYRHRPPDGQSSLVVDNRTGDRIWIYADGVELGRASRYDDRIFDLPPGQRRLVLDQDGGGRYRALDVDLLEGRLTILIVYNDSDNFRRYRVDVYLDD